MADPAQVEAERIRHTQAWRDARAQALTRDRGLCVLCLKDGRTMVATEVDHIVELVARPDLATDLANLQSLCRAHHHAKSMRERQARQGKPGRPA